MRRIDGAPVATRLGEILNFWWRGHARALDFRAGQPYELLLSGQEPHATRAADRLACNRPHRA